MPFRKELIVDTPLPGVGSAGALPTASLSGELIQGTTVSKAFISGVSEIEVVSTAGFGSSGSILIAGSANFTETLMTYTSLTAKTFKGLSPTPLANVEVGVGVSPGTFTTASNVPAGWVSATQPAKFRCLVGNEYVVCESPTSATSTIRIMERGAEGSTVASHVSGVGMVPHLTRGTLIAFLEEIGEAEADGKTLRSIETINCGAQLRVTGNIKTGLAGVKDSERWEINDGVIGAQAKPFITVYAAETIQNVLTLNQWAAYKPERITQATGTKAMTVGQTSMIFVEGTGTPKVSTLKTSLQPEDGRLLTIVNRAAVEVEFENQAATGTAEFKMLLSKHEPVKLKEDQSIQFVYDRTRERWVQVAAAGV